MILIKNEPRRYDIIKDIVKKIKDKYGIEVYDLNSFSYWIKLETSFIDEDQKIAIIRTILNNRIKYRNEE